MAKAKTSTPAVKTEGNTVTIKDLSIEYGVEAADLRALLRANGMKAPEVTREPGTFGPKSKYEWATDSADLAKVRKLITITLENSADDGEEVVSPEPKAPKAAKKAKK